MNSAYRVVLLVGSQEGLLSGVGLYSRECMV